MTEDDLQHDIARLSELVRQVASDGACPDHITEGTRFVEDVGMESINRLMLMTLVEGEFGVSLEEHLRVLIDLHTVGDTARFIHALKHGS
jgi:acyl carrier protein